MPSSHPQPSVVLVRPKWAKILVLRRGDVEFRLDRMRVVAPAMDGPVKGGCHGQRGRALVG